MLDPSSSEEEGDEILPVDHKHTGAPKSLGGARQSPGRSADGHGTGTSGGNGLQPRGRGSGGGGGGSGGGQGGGGGRPCSPSPSVGSEKEKEDLEKMQREEEEKKKRLQLYVFVMRCIAYPFNAKQPTDMTRRQQKVRSEMIYVLVGNKERQPPEDRALRRTQPSVAKQHSRHQLLLPQPQQSPRLLTRAFSAATKTRQRRTPPPH